MDTRQKVIDKLVNKYFKQSDVLKVYDCLFYLRVITKDNKRFDVDNINGLTVI